MKSLKIIRTFFFFFVIDQTSRYAICKRLLISSQNCKHIINSPIPTKRYLFRDKKKKGKLLLLLILLLISYFHHQYGYLTDTYHRDI